MIINTKNIFLNIQAGRETKIDGDDEIKILATENFDRKLKMISSELKNKPNEILNLKNASVDQPVFGSIIDLNLNKENINKGIIFDNKNVNNKNIDNNKNIIIYSDNKSSISSSNNSKNKENSPFFHKPSKISLFNETIKFGKNDLKKKSHKNFTSESNNDISTHNLKNKQGILKNLNNNTLEIDKNLSLGFSRERLSNSYICLKNSLKNLTIHSNEERYKGFKEDFKRYMTENKKKLLIPERNIKYIENKFSFFSYLFSLCSKKKKKVNGIYILDVFRTKLLSEEHLYRAHINLYSLEKYFGMEKENFDILELYKNL